MWGACGAQELEARTVSVFCAEAAARPRGWEPERARDVPSAHLLEEGYTCVAQEGSLCVTIRAPEEGAGAPLTLIVIANDLAAREGYLVVTKDLAARGGLHLCRPRGQPVRDHPGS
jgi:hypothetical protein